MLIAGKRRQLEVFWELTKLNKLAKIDYVNDGNGDLCQK